MIYITGDLHGDIGISKLNTKNFPMQKSMSKKDYLIILGDFGLVWNNSKEEKYWQNWLNDKSFTTLFIDGNHENFDVLNTYPVIDFLGGKVHQIKESIYHLMRGEIFVINGKKFFCFGGARSTDKEQRKEHVSWWKEEEPGFDEIENGFANLKKNDFRVDYVLTHTSTTRALYSMNGKYYSDYTVEVLNNFEDKIQFNRWYFGHHHVDKDINWKYTALFNDFISL